MLQNEINKCIREIQMIRADLKCSCKHIFYDIWCHINHPSNQDCFFVNLCHWQIHKTNTRVVCVCWMRDFMVGLKCEILISLMLSKTALSIMQFESVVKREKTAGRDAGCWEAWIFRVFVMRVVRIKLSAHHPRLSPTPVFSFDF